MKDINTLFVDDEEFTLKALERILRKESYARYYAESGAEAMRIMADTPIHILVTDIRMPEMDGMSLLRQVKEHYPDTVRLALSAYSIIGQPPPRTSTGEIFRFITKPIDPNELRQAINDAIDYYLLHKDRIELVNALKEKNRKLQAALEYQVQIEEQLRQLAITDELTRLFNRRHLKLAFDNEFNRCRRYGTDLSCLMLDLDHFKQINDAHGHNFGNFVLREFSLRLKKAIRNADLAFRYGGEEFLVLLPHTVLENALIIGDRIRQTCRAKPFEQDDRSVTATVSIGVVCLKHHCPQTAEEMLAMVDKFLYEAKNSGRDKVHY